ncbi:MAG: addiction module protein [Synechococcales bacterium]|nr:addiction module protein [Synechococcales bacterium]
MENNSRLEIHRLGAAITVRQDPHPRVQCIILAFPAVRIEVADDIELNSAQQQELDRRLEIYETNPGEGISWETLKASLIN